MTYLAGLLALASSVALATPLTQPCRDFSWDFAYSGKAAWALTAAAIAISPHPPTRDLEETASVKGFFIEDKAFIFFLDPEDCVILGTIAPPNVVRALEALAGIIPQDEVKALFHG